MMAFEGGYLGVGPPPTKQKMLHRNSISTMLMPPSSKSRRSCSARGRCQGRDGDSSRRSRLRVPAVAAGV
jgi:hypothetical protein